MGSFNGSTAYALLSCVYELSNYVLCINPFLQNVFSLSYQLDEFISNFRVVGRYYSFLFKFRNKLLQANSGKPDQTPHFAASDLVLHCLPMSH